MIGAFDVETRLIEDGIKPDFILGCLLLEGRKSGETFYSRSDMWNRIIELGIKEHRKGKTLTLYAHNCSFDFFQIADLTDKRIKYFCHRPFIVSFVYEGREIIKFLDTYSLYRMKLKDVGELIGVEKGETPLDLLNKKDLNFIDLNLIKDYCMQDCSVTLQAILLLKDMLKKSGINVKRIYTAGQISINYLINELRKGDNDHILFDKKYGKVWRTRYADLIREAYRGGRNEAFKSGSFYGVNYLDINSLYPYCMTQLVFPDLRTEQHIISPLNYYSVEDLFNKIGVSKCLLFNDSNDLGLLCVRTSVGNYYPRSGCYLYGTWTHLELSKAIKEGYKVLRIEESVIYSEGINPFKDIFLHLFEQRQKGGFEKYFYKLLMNSGIGKMAQHKGQFEIVIDDVERAEDYLNKNYEIIGSFGMDYVLEKKNLDVMEKPYHMPIIPTLINAMGRIFIYDAYKKVPRDCLIYSDTDSIMFQGDFIDRFDIGDGLGQFKVEVMNGFHKNYGKKTYRINDEIKIGGINRRNLSIEDFDEGIVLNTKMHTFHTTNDISMIGGFHSEVENLNERKEKLALIESKFDDQVVFIDESTTINSESIVVLKNYLENTKSTT